MSLMSKNSIKHKLPELNEAAQYTRWLDRLQDYAFRLFKNNNLSAIQPYETLSDSFFRRLYADEWRQTLLILEAGGMDVEADDFTPLDPALFSSNNELFDMCFEHALDTGIGFRAWVYTFFSDIKQSLGPDMADKTASVRHGDLVGLFRAIKLAVNHHEIFNPDDLETEYTKCTMMGEGQNELMRFISVLATFIRRLEAAGYPPRDSKKQRIILTGLDQDIFENFISNADRTPCAS